MKNNSNKSSKAKTITLVVVLTLMLVLIAGLMAAVITGTRPQDWVKSKDNVQAVKLSPVELGTALTFDADAEGENLYITIDKDVLENAKTYATENPDKVFISYFFKTAIDLETFDVTNAFGDDTFAFGLFFEDDAFGIMFNDEARLTVYNFATGEFGDTEGMYENTVENMSLTVDKQGKITISKECLEAYGIDTVYYYHGISVSPDDGEAGKAYCWDVAEINKIFGIVATEA